MRRTKRQWQSCGKLLQAKKIRYFVDSKSKNVRKNLRLSLMKKHAHTAYLQKVGRLPAEEQLKQQGGRGRMNTRKR